MYEKFAPSILCMESTHKTNSFLFKVITLLVPDKFRHGYPALFAFQTKKTNKLYHLFCKMQSKHFFSDKN